MDRVKKATDVLRSDCKNKFIINDMVTVLETEIEDLRNSLQRLVDLKDYKDNYGKNYEYLMEQPLAWDNARGILIGKKKEKKK